MIPDTRYLQRDGGLLAYQDVGHGDRVVFTLHEAGVHIDLMWTDPTWCRQWARFGPEMRTLMCQPRGLGMSDPVSRPLTPEEVAADVVAIMDAENVESAILCGSLMTAAAVLVCAAAYPERVEGALVWNPLAQGPLASGREQRDLWPSDEEATAFARAWGGIAWGSGDSLKLWDPMVATPRNMRLAAMLERTTASPPVAQAYIEAGLRADVLGVLPHVRAPVIVRHTPSTTVPESLSRGVAELVQDGSFEPLEPTRPEQSMSDTWVHVWERVAEMISGAPPGRDRHVATLLFTDVVDSTGQLARIGDGAWSALLARHDELLRERVGAHGGELLKLLGDGSMSVFSSTRSAIACAETLHGDARDLGIELRAGVHAGEIEHREGDVSGLAVHVAARVAAAAATGQTLVTAPARDLASDGVLDFADVGERELKGVPGRVQLYAVSAVGARAPAIPDRPTPFLRDRLAVGAARRAPRVMRTVLALGERRARRRAHA